MPRTRRLAAAAAFLVSLALPVAAHAAPIAVTSTGDGTNPIGCSLREAIESANTNSSVGGCPSGSGSDVISLPTGTYTLTKHGAGNNDVTVGSGDLDVDGNLIIQGAGTAKSIVDGDAADRVFDFVSGASELRDLTVRNGRTPDGDPGVAATIVGADSVGGSGESAAGSGIDEGDGGGIRNVAVLTLTRVTVTGNRAGNGGFGIAGGTANDVPGGFGGGSVGGFGGHGGNGGGIANDASGVLTVADSVVTGNFAGSGGAGGDAGQAGLGLTGGNTQGGGGGRGGNGGGIYQQGVSNATTLLVSRTSVTGNFAGSGGVPGGGGTAGAPNGSATVSSGGRGGSGGGIYVEGGNAMNVSQTTIADNAAGDGSTGGAGGAAASGSASGGLGGFGGNAGGLATFASNNSIDRSAVVRNSAGSGGDGGAGGATTNGGNTFAGGGGGGGDYGGVAIGGITQAFANTTVAENAAGSGGSAGALGTGTGTNVGGTTGKGGNGGGVGIESGAPQMSLTHLTIASNSIGSGSPAGSGGGLYHEGAPNAPVLVNTIVASNNGDQCAGTNSDGGHNISFPDPPVADCAATIHDDPKLGTLGDHGGPTPTMQLLPGSPAIDAAGTGGLCATIDQRGVPRPKGPACDIGAVERSVPGAISGGANSIKPRQASVAGNVDTGQLPTFYFFRFGRTPAYSAKTATASAGSGGGNVLALATLRGLTPNAVYHYRLFAVNPDGTVTGADRTFRTKALRFPGVTIRTASTTVRKGESRIEVACPGRTAVVGRCNGTLALRKRITKDGKTTTVGFGRRTFSIRAGQVQPVKVPLSDAGSKLLAERGTVEVKAVARAIDARRGAARFATRKVTLKSP